MRQIAYFPTEHAAQYAATMAKHFGHKLPVEVTGDTVVMRFEAGPGQMVAQPGGLSLQVEAPTAEDAAMLADVLERHLLRFAHREEPAPLVWAIA